MAMVTAAQHQLVINCLLTCTSSTCSTISLLRLTETHREAETFGIGSFHLALDGGDIGGHFITFVEAARQLGLRADVKSKGKINRSQERNSTSDQEFRA